MKLYRGLSDLPASFAAGAVTIGNFDGVHRGHNALIGQLCRRAAEHSGPATVFTFAPSPSALLHPDSVPLPLTWLERKATLLGELGVDVVIAFPTDRALLDLTPEAFFADIVCRRLQPRAVVEGPNFLFGKNRTGTLPVLRDLCQQRNIMLDIIEPIASDTEMVSSSRVRRLLSSGSLAQANSLLTRPYRLRGTVVHGLGRGRGLGIPTANLSDLANLVPAAGVYAGIAWCENQSWKGAINIGPNATFGESEPKVEAHLLDFSPEYSLYGKVLELELSVRLRDVQAFASVPELLQQIEKDIAQVRGGEVNSP